MAAEQAQLFGTPHNMRNTLAPTPFVATSPTSKAAATEIKKKGPELRERVYEVIGRHSGITDEEIASYSGLNPSTARPRRVELVKAGRVVQVGTGITSSGRKAALWATVPANDRGSRKTGPKAGSRERTRRSQDGQCQSSVTLSRLVSFAHSTISRRSQMGRLDSVMTGGGSRRR